MFLFLNSHNSHVVCVLNLLTAYLQIVLICLSNVKLKSIFIRSSFSKLTRLIKDCPTCISTGSSVVKIKWHFSELPYISLSVNHLKTFLKDSCNGKITSLIVFLASHKVFSSA